MTSLLSRLRASFGHRNDPPAMHPDAGGDPAMFRRATEARDLLVAQP